MTEQSDGGRSMRDISHTHPYADEGAMTRVFDRGPVAADGGKVAESGDRRETADDDADVEEDGETMADVEHTPPEGAGDADGVFERGYEKRAETEERVEQR
ncbi:hypothetical protein [Haladaptatus salinisoli]|uniref:hypothetical protein n=1 Tax=Haladaptatus salinisoli TaxID=2884876 RepID=UPI001D0B0A56|nr:hypothetical protein [Haladaptatus salinisoli]